MTQADPVPAPRARWRRLLAEPLVHFAALAAAFFVLYAVLHQPAGADIVVTDADVERLRLLAVKQYGANPDPARLREIVRSFVREEVLYREAQAMGLDRDDVIVRRRLVQKFDYLAQAEVMTPTENELAAYYATRRDAYAAPVLHSFEQIHFSARHPGDADVRARAALVRLQAGQAVDGDPSMLARAQPRMSQQDIARDFGADFAAAVAQLAPGQWHGPLKTATGLHLVRVGQRSAAAFQPLDAVRDAVKADLTNERLQQAREQAYARVRKSYRITMPAALGAP